MYAYVFYLRRTAADRFVYLSWKDKEPLFEYDAYFTWRNFSGLDLSEEAIEATVYLWNGKEVGQGRAGFKEIVKRVKALRSGAHIKVFPNYYAFPEGQEHYGPGYSFPFHDDEAFGELRATIASRRMTLVYSTRDHQGELLPVFKEYLKLYPGYR